MLPPPGCLPALNARDGAAECSRGAESGLGCSWHRRRVFTRLSAMRDVAHRRTQVIIRGSVLNLATNMKAETELKDALKRSSHMFDQVHDALWDLIIKGEIQPGDRLKDSEWCIKLGVSRTPVREAMRKLQQEGVLLPLSAGGYQVKNVSNKDLAELYTCRAALETLATVQASERLSSEEGKQLLALIGKADAAIEKGKIDEAFRINSAFHARVFELAGNGHLNFLGESLSKLVLFYRSALLNRVKKDPSLSGQYADRLRAKQDAHRAIVGAMLEGKHQEAGELMREHVLASIKELAM